MGRLLILASLLCGFSPAAPARDTISSLLGESYYPLGKGYKWTYGTDYADDTELIHEVTDVEKIGEIECFVVEHKTVGPTLGTRLMRKEWLAADKEGVVIHKLQRGRSELEVVKPFYKIKDEMRKEDEWKGDVKASENPPQYTIRVEEKGEVEVPAGKFTAWKVNVKIESGTRHSAESTEWYAKGVGLVKAETTIHAAGDTFTLVSELKKFEGKK